MIVRRWAAVVGMLGAGLVAGCGDSKSCDTPEVNRAPTSCTLAPNTDVRVNVGWCNCSTAVTCDVSFDSGQYFLSPRLASCDTSCPSNPTGCDLDTVPCEFTTPAAGTYQVNIISGLGTPRAATFTVTDGGGTSCGS